MDELEEARDELAQLSRLALSDKNEDVRLYVARLVRKYRNSAPELSEQMDLFLKNRPSKKRGPLRKASGVNFDQQYPLPIDDESRLSLLKVFHDAPSVKKPLMSQRVEESLSQLIEERRQTDRLLALGLMPTCSAIFVGEPGVGKTVTARWLASQLGVPLYILDLTAVMSSFLGRSGSNLRAAIDYAKRSPCVLLLDEIDAIAKRRSDDADIGELKRLVTVMLQEVEEWQASGLLLAATNHPELIDPALWRRFDLVIDFDMPSEDSRREAIERFFGPDFELFQKWMNTLVHSFKGQSYSDIERSIQKFRRALALGISTDTILVEEFIKERISELDRKDRHEIAFNLAKDTSLSQHAINRITGVSRDTIRKHTEANKL
ncbi:MAG: AAA family ATPase [Candidatus Thiodiazotropha endolucinida]